jgi:hypothetical protein
MAQAVAESADARLTCGDRLQRLGGGWVAGPSRKDVQRPSGDPLQTAPWAGCRAVSSPPGTARMGLRITPSQSAHSPQSPRKVRNSANIGCRRPTMVNDERAAQMRVLLISAHSRTPRVRSGSSTPPDLPQCELRAATTAVGTLRPLGRRPRWPWALRFARRPLNTRVNGATL